MGRAVRPALGEVETAKGRTLRCRQRSRRPLRRRSAGAALDPERERVESARRPARTRLRGPAAAAAVPAARVRGREAASRVGGRCLGGRGRRGLGAGILLDGLSLHLLHRLRQRRALVIRELVDGAAAAGQRGGGGRHCGDLLAGGELGGGVEAVAQPRHRFDQASQRSTAVRRHERGRRHQRRHPLRRGAELAQPRAAAQAGAHVRAQDRELLGARFTVRERRQQRLVARALGATLDARHPSQERLAALCEEPVHLRVRPARHRADLAIGEALRLQPQRAHLVRL